MYGEPSISEQLLTLIGWVVGVLLALTVGASLVTRSFIVPYVPDIAQIVLGWVIMILTLLGIILAFVNSRRETY